MPQTHLQVKLVRWTENPDQLVAAAARLCYAAETDALLASEPADDARFIARLRSLGHFSPFEHASFTFYAEGISRALTHQLVRHRLASYSQRSQRYVAHNTFDYIVPPRLTGRSVTVDGQTVPADAYFRETMDLLAERYGHLQEALGGSSESSNEDARYLLPNACETRIFITMNARELLHFFGERICQRAQWEIRALAAEMHRLAKAVAPALFAGSGPKCVPLGHCPEGKLSCGRYGEMKQRYA